MWAIYALTRSTEAKQLFFLMDEQDVLRWSGTSFREAIRFLESQGQEAIAVEVANAIEWMGPGNGE